MVYPKDTTEACSIKSWEKGVGLACKFKGAGAEASSSKPQQQQLFSRILCDILEARGEVLVSRLLCSILQQAHSK